VKRIILGVTLAVAAAGLPASRAHALVALGLKGGIGVSQVSADLFDTDNRTGFAGGAYLAFELGPTLALQPELLFVRKGAELFSTDVTLGGITFGEVGTTLDVDYLEVPLLLRLSLVPAGPVNVRLLGGPVASIKIDEKVSTTGLIDVSLDSDQVKGADFGLALGGAVALSAGGVKLVGEGRYTFGLSNVSDLPFGGDVNNRAIYALVGLEFPLVP
jgi:hypothetical protein